MSTKSNSKRRPKGLPIVRPQPDHRAILARRLDLIADIELQHGHHASAEHLSTQVTELRGAA
jgi:hypothetical protein